MKPIPTTKLSLLALAALMPCAIQAAQIDVVATQTTTTSAFGTGVNALTTDTTWTKDNVYILTDKVFVGDPDGAGPLPAPTLTIEPGTKIYSTLDDLGTPAKDDDQFGALVITIGSKLIAQGTAEEPIIFTTTDELEHETQTDIDGDTFVAEAPNANTYGRWGGLVVLGDAPIARYAAGPVAVLQNRVEGFQPASSDDDDGDGLADVIEYGGSDATDDSGIIQYVSIRHGGYVYDVANNSEINGLTLGGVGSGTTIDHVEVFANADDGIEFFGGTVNTSHIVLAFNQDDGFDIDEGYNGTNQFWFGIQAPLAEDGVSSGHDNGGEWDGVTGTLGDYSNNSAPKIYNATFIGSGTTALAGNDKGNNAIFIDDRFKGLIYDSVFDDFSRDLVGSASDGPGTGLSFFNNTVGRFGDGTPGNNLTYVSDAGAANTFFDGGGTPINGNSAGGVNPLYTAYSRDGALNLEVIDPRPAASSPLLVANGATLHGSAPVTVDYRGAFGPDENWAAGWTKMDEASFFNEKVEVVAEQTTTTSAFGTGVNALTTDTTWTKDKIYILRDKVFVGDPDGAGPLTAPTLTIEPGTKIYSTLDDLGTPAKDDDEFGALVITIGSQLIAQGTAEEPIVFTTTDALEAESLTDVDGDGFVASAPTANTYGRWGGLVVLGDAPIARYAAGPVAVVQNRVEGFQPASSDDDDGDGLADVIEYGGSDATDNSGIIQYVSIRHGGYVYDVANNSEINGLTLGGVGSGTTIDHVEVFANADDGIEFFGGTVNTSHIVLAFNQDDGFDIDEGYNGTNQFWFGIQAPLAEDGVSSGHDNGGEWDGVTGTLGDYSNNSAPTIYNATFIGSGTTALAGNDKGNNAIFLDDRFKGFVYNSVFDDFSRDVVGSASDGPGTGLTFAHNTVGRFGGGAFNGSNASNLTFVSDAGAANTFFNASGSPINGNSNGGVNPQYRAYSRDGSLNLVEIDPRPASGSPLLSASLQAGAPVEVSYRGAFGPDDNWAAGWTFMSQSGLLAGESATGGSIVDTDGDGVSDDLENANTDLGFNAGVNDAATVLGSVYTAAQVQADPELFGLYNETSILDLRTVGQTMVQKVGGNVTLTVPVEKSTGLNSWAPAGSMSLGPFAGDPNKEFYRLKVEGAQ